MRPIYKSRFRHFVPELPPPALQDVPLQEGHVEVVDDDVVDVVDELELLDELELELLVVVDELVVLDEVVVLLLVDVPVLVEVPVVVEVPPVVVGELGPGPEPVLDEAELELVAVVVPPCVSDGGTCR